MHRLELKVPPPLAGAIVASLMWVAASWPPALPLPEALRWTVAGVLVALSLGFELASLHAFRRSRTTINPLRPDRTSALVTDGVYRVTRNPMYVGMALLLTAWAVYLSALWPFVGPALFIAYITRFQIVPEERMLAARFPEFPAYAARVRRWL